MLGSSLGLGSRNFIAANTWRFCTLGSDFFCLIGFSLLLYLFELDIYYSILSSEELIRVSDPKISSKSTVFVVTAVDCMYNLYLISAPELWKKPTYLRPLTSGGLPETNYETKISTKKLRLDHLSSNQSGLRAVSKNFCSESSRLERGAPVLIKSWTSLASKTRQHGFWRDFQLMSLIKVVPTLQDRLDKPCQTIC